MVAVLSGLYRHSSRMVQNAMGDVFGIPMSLGTVNKLKLEASNALEAIVEEAKIYVPPFPLRGSRRNSLQSR